VPMPVSVYNVCGFFNVNLLKLVVINSSGLSIGLPRFVRNEVLGFGLVLELLLLAELS
jgi:hypothetical protein